jgi:DNA-binding MarR family transcriptional regulator
MARTGQFREALTRLSRRFNALQRGEKRCFGVTMPQCLALELLHQEGPQTVRGLADGLGLETSSATRLIDGLARDGLVARRRDEEDRRRVFLSLTESGNELAVRLEGCADEYTERILACIPRGQRRDLLAALRLLADAFEKLPGACTCQSPGPTKRSQE